VEQPRIPGRVTTLQGRGRAEPSVSAGETDAADPGLLRRGGHVGEALPEDLRVRPCPFDGRISLQAHVVPLDDHRPAEPARVAGAPDEHPALVVRRGAQRRTDGKRWRPGMVEPAREEELLLDVAAGGDVERGGVGGSPVAGRNGAGDHHARCDPCRPRGQDALDDAWQEQQCRQEAEEVRAHG
jgi:hypothetical protein